MNLNGTTLQLSFSVQAVFLLTVLFRGKLLFILWVSIFKLCFYSHSELIGFNEEINRHEGGKGGFIPILDLNQNMGLSEANFSYKRKWGHTKLGCHAKYIYHTIL